MRKLMDINLFVILMSDSQEKETITMKDLSAAIENDLDNGKYLNDQSKNDQSDNENEKLLKKQYEELQKLKELRNKYNDDPKPKRQNPVSYKPTEAKPTEAKSTEDKPIEEEEKSSGIIGLIKEPIILIILYIVISHPALSSLLGKYIPFFKAADDGSTSIVSLLAKAVLFAVIFFIIKIFL